MTAKSAAEAWREKRRRKRTLEQDNRHQHHHQHQNDNDAFYDKEQKEDKDEEEDDENLLVMLEKESKPLYAAPNTSLYSTRHHQNDTESMRDRDKDRGRSKKVSYVPHISAAKRRRLEREALERSLARGRSQRDKGDEENAEEKEGEYDNENGNISSAAKERGDRAKERKILSGQNGSHGIGEEGVEKGDDNDHIDDDFEDDIDQQQDETDAAAKSLLEQAVQLRQNTSTQDRSLLAQKEEEKRILREASKVQTNALQAASEVAKGVTYTHSIPTSWRVPKRILQQGETSWNQSRKNWHILVEGEDIPPPMKSFGDMRLPSPILNMLNDRNIHRPTPIQMQGLPVALAGRDMVGIAFTGSGKTMTFSVPLVMAALQEEMRMPIVGGEGPIGIILAPSRELVRQTYDLVRDLCHAMSSSSSHQRQYPTLHTSLIIGGENAREQLEPIRERGVHCVVATPGRLKDFLKKGSLNLDNCRYICLDEADRMLDLGFDEEVGEIMNHFRHQRQTLLFSATFPKKFQDFAKHTLIQPIVVNVGRAGAANLDVIQEVEYVKQEAKIVYLLQCLQKTAPPVVIFCERKGDVDDIHEYLLLKGVEAVSIHGGKEQEERNEAIQLYKSGQKDVLVATDIAAKGLDFADIQHVINFDMPSEIENYVHRIGRTGRCGKTGVATTFINKSCEETTLLDLKHLLKEAKQRIPPVLLIMDDPLEQQMALNAAGTSDGSNGDGGVRGCSFCGGLGHTIVDCPKIDKDARRVTRKDALASGDGYGGDW
eukprot:CAMPEP_0184862076 /NCGR_PEP_ID=MMETSP0580-20130426/6607_1 /TAXON_ID=1118495 /ORGANISM="Dactyliosolen fragilissimus" /LENGTH=769 /DNA_ID=CAMNT_0027359799 /DNA_START=69 /DNA_END=2378 /DNA_ORIENTATION=+